MRCKNRGLSTHKYTQSIIHASVSHKRSQVNPLVLDWSSAVIEDALDIIAGRLSFFA